jgi:hypothetical protein
MGLLDTAGKSAKDIGGGGLSILNGVLQPIVGLGGAIGNALDKIYPNNIGHKFKDFQVLNEVWDPLANIGKRFGGALKGFAQDPNAKDKKKPAVKLMDTSRAKDYYHSPGYVQPSVDMGLEGFYASPKSATSESGYEDFYDIPGGSATASRPVAEGTPPFAVSPLHGVLNTTHSDLTPSIPEFYPSAPELPVGQNHLPPIDLPPLDYSYNTTLDDGPNSNYITFGELANLTEESVNNGLNSTPSTIEDLANLAERYPIDVPNSTPLTLEDLAILGEESFINRNTTSLPVPQIPVSTPHTLAPLTPIHLGSFDLPPLEYKPQAPMRGYYDDLYEKSLNAPVGNLTYIGHDSRVPMQYRSIPPELIPSAYPDQWRGMTDVRRLGRNWDHEAERELNKLYAQYPPSPTPQPPQKPAPNMKYAGTGKRNRGSHRREIR